MIIQKKRVNKVDKYIERMGNTEEFYVCVKNNVENREILKRKGICTEISSGTEFVPAPVGPVTLFNASGKGLVRNDLEKEPRTIEHDFHITDWHGQDHYGTCYQTRMCFPIERILPPCEKMIVEDTVIRSEVLEKRETKRIKHIINIFLEIFGMCEVVDVNFEPISSRIIRRVPWTILPPGKYPWDKAKTHLKKYFENVPESRRMTIKRRHKILSEYAPDFLAIGEESFKGYIVYGYTERNIYCFESDEPNNATYIFKGKWEAASKLTKRDIISGNLCYKRLIHTQNWERYISRIMME